MKISDNQAGASHIVALFAVLVIAAVGFVGYRVLNSNSDTADSTTLSSSSKEPATIKSKADFNAASKSLDNTAVDSSVDPGSLDSDLNSLL